MFQPVFTVTGGRGTPEVLVENFLGVGGVAYFMEGFVSW